MEEIWKDVVGYEGLYQISNYGRLKSFDRIVVSKNGVKIPIKGKFLRPWKNKTGYYVCCLTRNYKHKFYLVHRLVAMTFLSNPNNFPYINHKDETQDNNFVYVNADGTVDQTKSNIEWCTPKYNANYGTASKRSIETRKRLYDLKEVSRKGLKTKTERGCVNGEHAVFQYDLNGNLLHKYSSASAASRELGIHPTIIRNACKGVIHFLKGCVFSYSEDKDVVKKKIEYKSKCVKPVALYRNGTIEKTWNKSKDAAEELGINFHLISDICNGKKNQFKEFELRFLDVYE